MNNKTINKILSYTVITSMLLMPTSSLALSKEETVYTKINNDKTTTIVSEHLINDKKEQSLTEKTDLTDIYNTNGDEEFKLDNNSLTWTTDGNDIYYQGTTDKELPIKTDITYKLDDNIMDINDMSGKSGKITIEIKNTNLDKHYVDGDTLYTPFVIAIGTSIPTSSNTNVEVTNGKVTSTGTTNIVAAISTPGLYESLNIDSFKSLDTVTITYDTTNFENNAIYMVATPKLVDSNDLDVFTKLDSIYDKANTLSSSSKLLVSGSKDLLTGITTYNSKFNEFSTGMNSVRNYTNVFNTNLDTISTGSAELNNNLTKLNNATKDLTTGITKLSNGATDLNKGASDLNTSISSITSGVKTSSTQLQQAITSGKLDSDTTKSYLTQLITLEKTFGVDKTLEAKGLTLDTTTATTTGYNVLISTLNTLENGSKQVSEGATELDDGINSKTGLAAQTKVLVNSISQLKLGSDKLNAGINSFKDGFNTYTVAVNKLADATDSLNTGAKQIESGASDLYNGINKFDNEGIQALTSLLNGKVKNTEDKVKELVKLSNNYQSFSNTNIKSNTKFITIVE